MSVTLDDSFNTTGKVIGALAYDYTQIQSIKVFNNKIIVAGYYEPNNDYVFLARYNLDGSIDVTFGVDGFVLTTYYSITANKTNIMIVQSDGKIIIICALANTASKLLCIRYNSNGTLDNTFGTNGVIDTLYTVNQIFSCFIQKQHTTDKYAICFLNNDNSTWCIQQYNTNGANDGSLITTNFDNGNSYWCFCFTIDYSNKLILGGRQTGAGGGPQPNTYFYESYNSTVKIPVTNHHKIFRFCR